jgi:hypothetical protein
VKQWAGIPDVSFICLYTSCRALFSVFLGLGLVKLFSQLSATRAPLGSVKYTMFQGVLLGCVNLSSTLAQGLGATLIYAPSDRNWFEMLEWVLIARIGMSLLGLIVVWFIPSFVYEDHEIRAGSIDEDVKVSENKV